MPFMCTAWAHPAHRRTTFWCWTDPAATDESDGLASGRPAAAACRTGVNCQDCDVHGHDLACRADQIHVVTGACHRRHGRVCQADVGRNQTGLHPRQQPRTSNAGRGHRLAAGHAGTQCLSHESSGIGNGTVRAQAGWPVHDRKVTSGQHLSGGQVPARHHDRDTPLSLLGEKSACGQPDRSGDQAGRDQPAKPGSLPGRAPSGTDQPRGNEAFKATGAAVRCTLPTRHVGRANGSRRPSRDRRQEQVAEASSSVAGIAAIADRMTVFNPSRL